MSAFRASRELDIGRGGLVELLEIDVLPQRDVSEFHQVESSELEAGPQGLQIGQFQPQKVLVPAAVEGQFIVRDDIGGFQASDRWPSSMQGTVFNSISRSAARRP